MLKNMKKGFVIGTAVLLFFVFLIVIKFNTLDNVIEIKGSDDTFSLATDRADDTPALTTQLSDKNPPNSDNATIITAETNFIPDSSDEPVYYRIKNLWKSEYLYQSGNQVMYGNLSMEDETMQWEIVSMEDGTYLIKNKASKAYINIENKLGYIECTDISESLDSTKWRIEDAGNGLFRIGSASFAKCYFHLENSKGYVEYGSIYPVWDSAKWSIEKVVDYNRLPTPLNTADDTPTKTLSKERGAHVPWITYEAEEGTLGDGAALLKGSIQIGDPSGEASGRKAVKLDTKGEYIEWKVTEPANALTIRLSVPDAAEGGGKEYTISIYKNGKHIQDLSVTSKYAWLYGNEDKPTNNPKDGTPRRIYDESQILLNVPLSKGDVIRLQKDVKDTANFYNIDFVELENVSPIEQPENSLSILEFGADGTDLKDDAPAIEKCIKAAKEQGKLVWMPTGTFYQSRKINAEKVTIQGSGCWYTTLFANSSSGMNTYNTGFEVTGDNAKFYDFKILGDGTIRGTGGNGFNGKFGVGSELHNIWVEHTTCGVWEGVDNSVNMGTDLLFEGCRFRDTFADGINLCNGTQNSIIRNCTTRNTGDDGIAIWSEGQHTVRSSYNNIIENCTAQLPWRAAGIAIYGGKGNIVQNNLISDTMTYPGLTVSSGFSAKPFEATTVFRYNDFVRCGGTFWNGKQFGAIWIQAADSDIEGNLSFIGNDIYNASYSGIQIQCEGGRKLVGDITFEDLDIKGTGTYGVFIKSKSYGVVNLINTRMSKIGSKMNINNASKKTFRVNIVDN